jgi:cohesin complex subunit SCC1
MGGEDDSMMMPEMPDMDQNDMDQNDMDVPPLFDETIDTPGMGEGDESRLSLDMSMQGPDQPSLNFGRESLGMGEEETPQIRVKKTRKRKLAVDAQTELSSKHIRSMLSDTSDIVRHRVPMEKRKFVPFGEVDILKLSMEERFARPCIPGIGKRGPLKKLFERMYRIGPLPFKMKETATEEEDTEAATEEGEGQSQEQGEQKEDEDVEVPRDADMSVANETADGMGEEFEQQQEDGMDMPEMPDMDESGAQNANENENAPEFNPDDESITAPDDFDLSAVNDFSEIREDDGDIEETTADGHTRKWHPHTVKVMELLRDRLETQESVGFMGMARGRKKRTAAGCFFELLQLKTWNYIDVKQDTAYGDIRVTKTKRFDEHVSSLHA